MASLKIKVYKTGNEEPETVVTIPLAILRIARGLLPQKAKLALENEGIDLNEIASLAEKQEVMGTLLEVEKGTEHIVIAIE